MNQSRTPSRSQYVHAAKPMTAAQRIVLRELMAFHTFSRIEIQTGAGIQGAALDAVLEALERRGLIGRCSNDEYIVTEEGVAAYGGKHG